MSCRFNCWHPQPGMKTAVSNCTTNGDSSCLMPFGCYEHVPSTFFHKRMTQTEWNEVFGSFSTFFFFRWWSRIFHAPALAVCPQWVLSQSSVRHATERKITLRSSWKRPHHRRADIRFIGFIRLLVCDENADMESPHISDGITWLWHTVTLVSKSFKPQSWILPRLQISNDNCG